MRRSTALMAALLLLAAAYMSIAAYGERSEEVETRTRRMFRDWMAKFDKTYDSIGEEEHRYAVFKENLRRRLDKHGTSVDAARLPNGFGDVTMEELRSLTTSGSVITAKDKEEFRSLNLGWIEKVKRFNFQYILMKDPVTLPSSKVTIDRPVIVRHLLSDSTDPFNRSHLTQDMLIPNTELKLQIEEFVRSQQSRKRSAAVPEIGEADGADDMAE